MVISSAPIRSDYEIVVVGAGAAGLSAGTVLGRCGRRVLVVGGPDRANSTATEVHNLPYAEGVSPDQLYAAMEAGLSALDVPLLRERVTTIASAGPEGPLRLTAGSAELSASRVLLATGLRHVPPPWMPDGMWGTTVFDCPFCHAREHAGEDFAAVGKGTHTIEMALLCIVHARSMTVIVTDAAAVSAPAAQRLAELGGEVIHDEVVAADLRPDGGLVLHTAAGRRLGVGAVLVTGVLRPRTTLAEQLGLHMAASGVPDVDADSRSSDPRVWIAGMAAQPRYMLVEAMGSGIRAAVALHKDLALAGISRRQ